MNKKDIKSSFDKIFPTKEQKSKMLEKILLLSENKKSYISIKRLIPLTAVAAIIMCAVLFVPDYIKAPVIDSASSDNAFPTDGGDMLLMQAGEGFSTDEFGETTRAAGEATKTSEPASTQDSSFYAVPGDEDCAVSIEIAQAQQTIVFGGRKYRCAIETEMQQYELKPVISQSDMGEFITYLENASAPELEGAEVCRLRNSDSEAIVLVYDSNQWYYYLFENFVSYEQNQDENALEYLKVFGVSSAEDIVSVTVNDYSSPAETLDKAQTAEFYDYFKALENSSDAYFEAIESYSCSEVPDQTSVIIDDEGNEIGMSTPAYSGSSAFDGAVCFSLTFENNYVREIWYYPNIGFLSRYKLSEDFSTFLASLV